MDSIIPITEQDNIVFSDSTNHQNMKPRACQCPICLYIIVTNMMGPKCKECNSYLITLRISRPINELAR